MTNKPQSIENNRLESSDDNEQKNDLSALLCSLQDDLPTEQQFNIRTGLSENGRWATTV